MRRQKKIPVLTAGLSVLLAAGLSAGVTGCARYNRIESLPGLQQDAESLCELTMQTDESRTGEGEWPGEKSRLDEKSQPGEQNRFAGESSSGAAYRLEDGCQENHKEPVPVTLPGSYDLRTVRTLPRVPDQGNLSTCWAFASLTALSTTLPEGTSLSADHMSLKNPAARGQKEGGDIIMSTAYLLAWLGPVSEARDPYGDGTSPDGLPRVCHVQSIKFLPKENPEAVKQAIITTGGVQSAIYFPENREESEDKYYREETASYYYNGEKEPNHGVVFIGWDDEYPRENFKESLMPRSDGAWLCMNSWGESFGMDGCFYVSYEDSQLGIHNLSFSGVESVSNYDRIYQSDLSGWTGQLGCGEEKAWFANVYQAKNDEIVEAVGFYATVPGVSYEVFAAPFPNAEETVRKANKTSETAGDGKAGPVLVSTNQALSAANRRPVAAGTLTDAGYFTIPFERGYYVNAGERFAVLVYVRTPGSDHPVAIEYASASREGTVDISDGEGYISLDGAEWISAETRERCNVCLKAYTRLQEMNDER